MPARRTPPSSVLPLSGRACLAAALGVLGWLVIRRSRLERCRSRGTRESALAGRRAARREARRASRLKDELVGALSHDLRTPLNAMTGWVHVLRRDPRPETLAQALEALDRNLKRQAETIERLLIEIHAGSVLPRGGALEPGASFVVRLPLARRRGATPRPGAGGPGAGDRD